MITLSHNGWLVTVIELILIPRSLGGLGMRLSFRYTDAFLTVLMWTTPQTVGPKHTTIQSVMSTEIMKSSNIIVVS